jgi:hypothetical protein
MDMFSGQDVSPQETGQGCAECHTERAIVDAEGHTIHGSPEYPVGNGDAVEVMNLLPSLDDAGKKDSGTDICSGELLRVNINSAV